MRIDQLTALAPGTRVLVTGVASGAAETLGHVNDQERLLGLTGTVERLANAGDQFAQLYVIWDDPDRGGSLALASADEVEVL